MAANPFTAQLDSLNAVDDTSQDQAVDTALSGRRAARHMRRAAKKASQTSTAELLAPSQAPQTAKLSPQHIKNGRSHQHILEKVGK